MPLRTAVRMRVSTVLRRLNSSARSLDVRSRHGELDVGTYSDAVGELERVNEPAGFRTRSASARTSDTSSSSIRFSRLPSISRMTFQRRSAERQSKRSLNRSA